MNEQFIDEVMGLVDLVSELTAQYMMVVEQGDEPIDEDRMLKELNLSIRAKLREVVESHANLGECIGCGHLYMEPFPTQCDCLENPWNKYKPWTARRAHNIGAK